MIIIPAGMSIDKLKVVIVFLLYKVDRRFIKIPILNIVHHSYIIPEPAQSAVLSKQHEACLVIFPPGHNHCWSVSSTSIMPTQVLFWVSGGRCLPPQQFP